MNIQVEKLNVNTRKICNLCETERAVARVYVQSRVEHEENVIPNGAIYFCKKCGPKLAKLILEYSMPDLIFKGLREV